MPSSAASSPENIKITKNFKIPPELFGIISRESAENYKMVPLKIDREEELLYIGAVDIKDLDMKNAASFASNHANLKGFKVQEISEGQFTGLLSQYEDDAGGVEDVLGELEEDYDEMYGDDDKESIDDTDVDMKPIVLLVRKKILGRAVKDIASDVHIESHEKQSVVRFRIDGDLQEVFSFPKNLHQRVVLYIKGRAKMKTDESRKPLDGGMTATFGGKKVDFRIATFPTVYGEKVIIRVLDQSEGPRSLATLGFTPDAEAKLRQAVRYKNGLVLVTGATGSGKTTVLASLIDSVDKEKINVVSLEDPVEYHLKGVSQSTIRSEIGYDFSSGLRSILRGDPDQILVGEIRDLETAELAVQAAITGHLVYSTLHTNTAVGAITRLLEFGVQPFLLSSVLRLVVGAALVKRIDGEGKERTISERQKERFEKQIADLSEEHRKKFPPLTSFRDPLPTDDNPSGLKGRIGVYEVFEVTDEIKELIEERPSEDALRTAARKNGYLTVLEDALMKGAQGLVPFDDILGLDNKSVLLEKGIDIDSVREDVEVDSSVARQ